MSMVYLITWFLCFSFPIFAKGLHFGIINAIKNEKGLLKEKIRKGEEYKKWQEERRKEFIYAGVCDESSPKIHIFNSLGEYVMGFGKEGTGDGEFKKPSHIWGINLPDIEVDNEDNLWAIDTGNFRIQKFDKYGNFLLKCGKKGTGTGEFGIPWDLAIDKNDNVYVLDLDFDSHPVFARIQKFDKHGKFLSKIDKLKPADWGEKVKFFAFSLAIDQNDNLYIVSEIIPYKDYFIYRFDQNGIVTGRFGNGMGTGTGQFEGDEVGIEIDNEGNIFVVDPSLCRVQKFDRDGNFLLKFGSYGTDDDEFQGPGNIDIDTKGNIYIVDKDIKMFDNNGKFLMKFPKGENIISISVNF